MFSSRVFREIPILSKVHLLEIQGLEKEERTISIFESLPLDARMGEQTPSPGNNNLAHEFLLVKDEDLPWLRPLGRETDEKKGQHFIELLSSARSF